MAKPNQANQSTNAIQKFAEWDAKTAQADEADAVAADDSQFIKLVQGKNVLRYLPGSPGHPSPFRVIYKHRLEVPGTDAVSFPCPRKEQSQSCPLCNEAARLQGSHNAIDQERGKNLLPKRKVFANVHPRAEGASLVKVHEFGKTIHDPLLQIRNQVGLDPTHPINGIDIIVLRKGENLETKYTVMPDPEGRTPLADDAKAIDEILDSRINLERFARCPTEAQIRSMMSGEKVEWRKNAGGAARTPQSQSARQPAGQTADDMIDGEGEFIDPNN